MIAGCVQRVFFPNVNLATIEVLTAEAATASFRRCRDVAAHYRCTAAGMPRPKGSAKALIDAFERENVDAIIINALDAGPPSNVTEISL